MSVDLTKKGLPRAGGADEVEASVIPAPPGSGMNPVGLPATSAEAGAGEAQPPDPSDVGTDLIGPARLDLGDPPDWLVRGTDSDQSLDGRDGNGPEAAPDGAWAAAARTDSADPARPDPAPSLLSRIRAVLGGRGRRGPDRTWDGPSDIPPPSRSGIEGEAPNGPAVMNGEVGGSVPVPPSPAPDINDEGVRSDADGPVPEQAGSDTGASAGAAAPDDPDVMTGSPIDPGTDPGHETLADPDRGTSADEGAETSPVDPGSVRTRLAAFVRRTVGSFPRPGGGADKALPLPQEPAVPDADPPSRIRRGRNPVPLSVSAPRFWRERPRGATGPDAPRRVPPPIHVVIGWIGESRTKDVLEHARAFARDHVEAVDNAWIALAEFSGGTLFEIHEGGGGAAYLPDLIEQISRDPDQVLWVPSGTRLNRAVTFAVVDGRPFSMMLTEAESARVRGSGQAPLERTGRMRRLVPRGTPVLVVGATLFSVTLLALLASALVSSRVNQQPIPSLSYNPDALPHGQIVTLSNALRDDRWVSRIVFENGAWRADFETIDRLDLPSDTGRAQELIDAAIARDALLLEERERKLNEAVSGVSGNAGEGEE